MGKQLIIKGADFYSNAIIINPPTWLFGYDDSSLRATGTFSSGNYFYITSEEIANNNISGCSVKFVKCYCSVAGTVGIGVTTMSGSNGTRGETYQYSVKQGINVIQLQKPITLSSTTSICFSGNGILQLNSSGTGWDFRRIGSTSSYNLHIPIDFGTLDE